MGFVYGSSFDAGEESGTVMVRCFINWWTTNNTNTTIDVVCDIGWQFINKTSRTVLLDGYLTGGYGTKSYEYLGEKKISKDAGGYYVFERKSKTITKTTSTQTFTVSLDWYSGANHKATATITIPALASYNVTFNANGGSGAPATQKKYYGKTLKLSTTKPTRAGYTFVRWNTNTSNTGTAYSPGGSYTGNAALTLYAIWKANTWTVSYNANGGSGAPANQTKTYGVNLTLSSTKPTRTGYTFSKWNTKANGSGTNYAPGASYTANAALTLYAIWTINTYAVTYNANGGSGAPAKQTKTYGTALTLSSTKPTRAGHTFLRWNTKSDGTGTNYASGASYTGNAALALYAVWQINTYAVTYNANGGSGAPASQTKTYGTDLTLSSTKPTRAGYAFKKWNTAADGTGEDYAPGATYADNAALTLYAIWEIYIAPMITNLVAYRADSAGTQDDEGTYGKVVFNWIEGTGPEGDVLPSAIKVGYRERGTGTYTYTSVSDLRSGTVSVVVGNNDIDLAKQYDIIVVLTPSGTDRADVSKTTYISLASFIIDVNANGTAVAIGVQAPDNMSGFVMGFDPYIALDTTAAAGTVDAELYDAICALGWQDDVIV